MRSPDCEHSASSEKLEAKNTLQREPSEDAI